MVIAGIALGKVTGHLGQCLAGGQTDADGHPHIAADALMQGLAPGFPFLGRAAGEAHKAFVDGVAPGLGSRLTDQAHHAGGELAVQLVVAAESGDIGMGILLLQLEIGHAGGDAQRLGFGGTGHHTAIVVAEHYHGLSLQIRPEHPFARHVAVVAVHNSVDHRCQFLMVHTTTPHT
jgi:hypothetical protein